MTQESVDISGEIVRDFESSNNPCMFRLTEDRNHCPKCGKMYDCNRLHENNKLLDEVRWKCSSCECTWKSRPGFGGSVRYLKYYHDGTAREIGRFGSLLPGSSGKDWGFWDATLTESDKWVIKIRMAAINIITVLATLGVLGLAVWGIIKIMQELPLLEALFWSAIFWVPGVIWLYKGKESPLNRRQRQLFPEEEAIKVAADTTEAEVSREEEFVTEDKATEKGSWWNPDVHFMLPAKGEETTKTQKFQRFMKSLGFWIMIVFMLTLARTCARYVLSG